MVEYERPSTLIDLEMIGLGKGSNLRLRVVSDSMSPMLRAGDILVVSAYQLDLILCGDLIVFELNQVLITHRVLEITGEFVQTKGDRWHTADPPVAIGSLVGLVQSRERSGAIINFTEPRWRRLNRTLGLLGRFQVKWIKMFEICGGVANIFRWFKPTWSSWPFRLVERLLLVVWGYR